MVDLHAHILPKIDDGVQNIQEAMQMIEEAKVAGFTKIIATSHYMEDTYEANEEERKKLMESIKNKSLEIILGNEIYITDRIIELLKEKKASTLNNSQYVLIEIPFHNNIVYFNTVIDDLKRNHYVPIIAHPERYDIVKQNPKIIEEWLNRGIYLQANYLSILGYYGKQAQKTLEILLRHQMIQFLGTDAHQGGQAYPEIKKAISKIKAIIGEQQFTLLSKTNAEKVLKNEEITIEDVTTIKKNIFGKYK